MIELVLMLQVVTLPQPARPQSVNTSSLDRCATAQCRERAALRYRVAQQSERPDDPVARAMHDDWSRCGLSGMPVCPSKGHVLFHGAVAALLGAN